MAPTDPRNVTFADLVKRGFNALQMDLEEARGDADLHDRGKTWVNEAVEELAAVWDWPRYSTRSTFCCLRCWFDRGLTKIWILSITNSSSKRRCRCRCHVRG